MRLLLTGGAGYVGSACLRWLLARGHEVWAFDDLSSGNAAAVPGDRLIVADIFDRAALARVLRRHRIEGVVHFAALASVPESLRDPASYWRVNVQGTREVLDAMREAEVSLLVFSSTAAVYDFDAAMPLEADSAKRPRVPYGESKLAAERQILDYARAYGLGVAILRYFNAAGADLDGRHGEWRRHETHLVPRILRTATGELEELLIFGDDWATPDGTCLRDYVHVRDLAAAHERVILGLEPGDRRTYNVGTGHAHSVRELVAMAERVCGRAIPHRVAPRRDGDPAILIASPRALMAETGWRPECSDLETIVSSAWRWHRDHPGGYEGSPGRR